MTETQTQAGFNWKRALVLHLLVILCIAGLLFYLRSSQTALVASASGLIMLVNLQAWVFLVKKMSENSEQMSGAQKLKMTLRISGIFILKLAFTFVGFWVLYQWFSDELIGLASGVASLLIVSVLMAFATTKEE